VLSDSQAQTHGRIGGLTRWAAATPDDRAAQRDILRSALRSKYEADALQGFRAKGYVPTPRELAESAEHLRRAAQLRAAMAGGRARRERARLMKGGR
jgi:hypothetical protein